MSSQGRSPGQDISVPAEPRCHAQDSVRECIASAGVRQRAGRGWVVPVTASATVAAAACVPVVWPALVAADAGSGAAALVGAAFSQVKGVGGNLVAKAVIRTWDRVRARRLADAGQANLRDTLAAELQTGLEQGTPAAGALREEIAGVQHGVVAVQVALTASIEESAADVRDMLVRGLRALGHEFAEFGWLLDEVNVPLAFIAEDAARAVATAREVADSQQQTLMELAMLRQEVRGTFGKWAARPDVALPAGPSVDEERVAALDAAAVPHGPAALPFIARLFSLSSNGCAGDTRSAVVISVLRITSHFYIPSRCDRHFCVGYNAIIPVRLLWQSLHFRQPSEPRCD